jgi:hypothetical protein
MRVGSFGIFEQFMILSLAIIGMLIQLDFERLCPPLRPPQNKVPCSG